MVATLLPIATIGPLRQHYGRKPVPCFRSSLDFELWKGSVNYVNNCLAGRRKFIQASNRNCKSRNVVFSTKNDTGGAPDDAGNSSLSTSGAFDGAEAEEKVTSVIIADLRAKKEALEKERDTLFQELLHSQVKQQEYADTIMHDKEVAIAELEAAKSLFNQKLLESVEDKFNLETKLVLAKQDAVELAVQVEKLAEIAFQQATSHILEDCRLKVSAAETTAAEATFHIEEQIRNATDTTMMSIVEQSKDAIDKALAVAERAGDYATKAMAVLTDGTSPLDEIASFQSKNIKLQSVISDLETQLRLAKIERDKIEFQLEQACRQTSEYARRLNDTEKALLEFQETSEKKIIQQEEEINSLLEKMKKDASERKKAMSKAMKAELEGIKAAVDAAKEVARAKDELYQRRCNALQRSLSASETASKMWRQRAESAESLLSKEMSLEVANQDLAFSTNGGRIDFQIDDDSYKWKLLTDGPRREIPDWMARRINTFCTKFPPRKSDALESITSKFKSLELPKREAVWSISQEKVKQKEVFVEHVIEKEIVEKKRKSLERALQRKTLQLQKTPEEIKLEPGTGTGREIVFQGFNWESWRRRWYLDLAPKAADLSQSGITAVWLPPPTQSVAPQGYMPSDLYNLNSAYGSVEELKYCIEEMHAQDLLALGDVVLNHRCAQKQSSNGVWNIFGGKLAWGPEAIVCDDPNFQGRGNPSSGDIFHAAPNVDHSQVFVRKDIKEWLNWLRNDIGYDGWRLDFVRGFSGVYVKEYIEASNPVFAIGEYWDSLAYEGGNLCYNQDAHRQRIINWINATGGTSSAFDVTTKGILHSALHNQYWRLIDPQGKPSGVLGWWPSRAVTFLENHDTGSTQGHWPFPRDKLMQGYAYILTHPGTPVVFYDHFYDFGIHDVITELIEARKRAGIHCRSTIKIFHANNDGYVAHIGDSLVVKLGQYGWNPAKENRLDGSWLKFIDKGSDYQIWLRQ